MSDVGEQVCATSREVMDGLDGVRFRTGPTNGSGISYGTDKSDSPLSGSGWNVAGSSEQRPNSMRSSFATACLANFNRLRQKRMIAMVNARETAQTAKPATIPAFGWVVELDD